MIVMQTSTMPTDEQLEVVFGIPEPAVVDDPDTEPGAWSLELPTDEEEFAAPPRDRP